ncbi:hypothetical protein WMY93_032551 [Mugilogobius chulae]|uniref:Uncharacterized protein n=1 Tax=Mugilogobius chulae TaxID=88201 RepID=A0AAW0MRI9_9GOBI
MCKQVCAVWKCLCLTDFTPSSLNTEQRPERESFTWTDKRSCADPGCSNSSVRVLLLRTSSDQSPDPDPGRGGFSYEYSLHVNGLTLQKFSQNRSRTTQSWSLELDRRSHTIVLEKDTMDVWCNGHKMEAESEFVDDGTETRFYIEDHEICLKAFTEQEKKKKGITYCLLLDGHRIHSD